MNTGATLTHDWFPRPLPANVVLGQRSWCYSSFSCLHYRSEGPCGVRVGHDSGIYHGTFFDLGPDGEVEIGNYCTLVGAIISTNSLVIIGDYTFLAHEVVLADSFAATPFELHSRPERQDKEDSPAGNPYFSYGNSGFPSSAKKIIIGENCWIGARAVLLSGASVGEGAIVGAAAVVDFEIPPYAVVAGNPARIVGKVEGRRK